MATTELNAQKITLLRIIEQCSTDDVKWTRGDAREFTRATGERLKPNVALDLFVARRAQLALGEIAKRIGKPLVSDNAPRWPVIIGWLILVAAFVTGFMTDFIPGQSQIEIIHLPLVLLILWNLFVYVFPLIVKLPGINRFVAYLAEEVINKVGRWRLREAVPARSLRNKAWMLRFQTEWLRLSSPLIKARISLVLHSAAIVFVAGAMTSLYARGVFKEYRAGWESTWLKSPESVRSVASVVLAPGVLLFNMQIPDVAQIASLQRPISSGGVANDWIHLYAGAVLGWIVIPRFTLLLWCSARRWRLQRAFPLPLHGLYFRTIDATRKGRGGFLVIPFRYELKPQTKARFCSLLEQIYGITAEISVPEPVLMGRDPADWKPALGNDDHIAVFVVFSLSATAEPDLQTALLKKLRRNLSGISEVIPIVDVGAYAIPDRERLRERREQWRSVLDTADFKPVFLDLSKPEDEQNLEELKKWLREID